MSGRAASPARSSRVAAGNNGTRSKANNGIFGKAARFMENMCKGSSCSRKKGRPNGNAVGNNLGERYARILQDNRELTKSLATARESERTLKLTLTKLVTAAAAKNFKFRKTVRRTNGYNATEGQRYKNTHNTMSAGNNMDKNVDRATITMVPE